MKIPKYAGTPHTVMEGENFHVAKDTYDSVCYGYLTYFRSQLCCPNLRLTGIDHVLKLVPVDACRLALFPHALHQVFGHGPRLRISFLLALLVVVVVVEVMVIRCDCCYYPGTRLLSD